MKKISVTAALSPLLLASLAATAFAQDANERIGQIIYYGCSHLNAPNGGATVDLAGEVIEVDAIAKLNQGALVVSLGNSQPEGPSRCMTFYSPGPVEPGTYELADPASVVMAAAGSGPEAFLAGYAPAGYAEPVQASQSGTLSIDGLDPTVRGSFSFVVEAGTISGTFDAVPLD